MGWRVRGVDEQYRVYNEGRKMGVGWGVSNAGQMMRGWDEQHQWRMSAGRGLG